MYDNETIAAISTANGEAGIGIVRMSGDDSVKIADKIFKSVSKKSLFDIENRKMAYGHIYDGDKLVDEVLIVKMLAPHTYTREDVVEIYCHGGIISVRKILNLLLDKGAVLAERGEFTKRAFLNGRLDLTQAEAVIDIIKSKSDLSYDMSIKQLEGSLKGKLDEVKENLISISSLIVANIDFPEDEIEEATYDKLRSYTEDALEIVEKLLENSNRGMLLRDGINTIILGKPNVGKSTLLNKLLRFDKAIVTDVAGTTRDIISDYINRDGIVLKLTDTAGTRDTKDLVEKIGVDRAKSEIDSADLIIAIFDGSRKIDQDDYEIINLIRDKKSIIIFNKDDLDQAVSEEEIEKLIDGKDYLRTSMQDAQDISKIENIIKDMFFEGEISTTSDVYVNNVRHIRALERTKKSPLDVIEDINNEMFLDLMEVNVNNALMSLGEITGETNTEDILDRVFSEFCIGK